MNIGDRNIPSSIILDLGIGKGGLYIKNDDSRTLRIGADIRTGDLQKVKKRFGLPVFKMDAFSESWTDPDLEKQYRVNLGFPVKKQALDGIDILFPHNELLLGLSRPWIWHEFARILKPNSGVAVTFDIPPEGSRKLLIKGEEIIMEEPAFKLWHAAFQAFSSVHQDRLSIEELKSLGTNNSLDISQSMKENPKHQTFRLIALPE